MLYHFSVPITYVKRYDIFLLSVLFVKISSLPAASVSLNRNKQHSPINDVVRLPNQYFQWHPLRSLSKQHDNEEHYVAVLSPHKYTGHKKERNPERKRCDTCGPCHVVARSIHSKEIWHNRSWILMVKSRSDQQDLREMVHKIQKLMKLLTPSIIANDFPLQ